MRKRDTTLSFFILLVISFLVFFLGKTGFFRPAQILLEKAISPIWKLYAVPSFFGGLIKNNELESLKEKNRILTKQIVDSSELQKENKALQDQFYVTSPKKSTDLMPAHIVGAGTFIPGISFPETFTLDKGSYDGVRVGSAVLFKDLLV